MLCHIFILLFVHINFVELQISLEYKPNRPFYHPRPDTGPSQLIPPGKPWPASAEGYANFSQTRRTTVRPITTTVTSLVDRIKDDDAVIPSSGSRPPFHPNPGDTISQIIPPGKPWPASVEGYNDFSQTTRRTTVKPNTTSITDLSDRIEQDTMTGGGGNNRPSFHPNPGDTISQIIPPGKPWPASIDGYTDFSQTTRRTTVIPTTSTTDDLTDRIKEDSMIGSGGNRPSFHPNPGDTLSQIIPPGKPWPSNVEDYANFSQINIKQNKTTQSQFSDLAELISQIINIPTDSNKKQPELTTTTVLGIEQAPNLNLPINIDFEQLFTSTIQKSTSATPQVLKTPEILGMVRQQTEPTPEKETTTVITSTIETTTDIPIKVGRIAIFEKTTIMEDTPMTTNPPDAQHIDNMNENINVTSTEEKMTDVEVLLDNIDENIDEESTTILHLTTEETLVTTIQETETIIPNTTENFNSSLSSDSDLFLKNQTNRNNSETANIFNRFYTFNTPKQNEEITTTITPIPIKPNPPKSTLNIEAPKNMIQKTQIRPEVSKVTSYVHPSLNIKVIKYFGFSRPIPMIKKQIPIRSNNLLTPEAQIALQQANALHSYTFHRRYHWDPYPQLNRNYW